MYAVIFNYADNQINIEYIEPDDTIDISVEEILDDKGYKLNNIDYMMCSNAMIKNFIKDSIDIL